MLLMPALALKIEMKSAGSEVSPPFLHELNISWRVVIIRVRPFLISEKTQGGKKGRMQCVETYNPHDDKSLSLIRPGFDQRDFRFDSVLEMDST